MEITGPALVSLFTGYSAAYQGGFNGVTPTYTQIAMTVTSVTRSNEYGWLGKFPRMREWIGDRVINALGKHGYTIRNRSFESTIAVDRDDIRDDQVGIYTPIFSEFGRSAAVFPDELCWALLQDGASTLCFDGQNYFDTDHPVILEDGSEGVFSNDLGGAGTAWYLVDTSRAIKPLVFQSREPFRLTRMDDDTSPAVFSKKEFQYGVDGRCNVGFTFPQLAIRSRQTLNAANYEAARAAMIGFKADHGLPLGIVPDTIITGPTLEGAAKAIVQSTLVNGGETNPWAGTAKHMMSPWLA
ncbi:Mu-like prophage major head subunit gpT family protein [Devosia sp. J2-20]|uniref:Mu-like prophage major head subunit gpT family protein n=1 Tax=Devosia sp. J2-20 TaxID=3026161 RepID=UPI00249CE879|nr:Mu-like prophage major head subunit gpT family protein [Devosia sp. J2-20]WDR00744.1 Mu-like prophage major head subunit gpT family protein [Devosia sp. J2-20]